MSGRYSDSLLKHSGGGRGKTTLDIHEMDQEQVFPSPPLSSSSPTLSVGTVGCSDSESCPCSLCGARYRVWALEVHVETEDGVEPARLEEKLQQLVEPAVHNYPEEGWSFALYGFYEPCLEPRGRRQYCVFVTMGAECLLTRLRDSVVEGLRTLQPREDPADVLIDVAGHGKQGDRYDPGIFWFWVDCCVRRVATGARGENNVGFGSKISVVENLRGQMRGAPPPPHMV